MGSRNIIRDWKAPGESSPTSSHHRQLQENTMIHSGHPGGKLQPRIFWIRIHSSLHWTVLDTSAHIRAWIVRLCLGLLILLATSTHFHTLTKGEGKKSFKVFNQRGCGHSSVAEQLPCMWEALAGSPAPREKKNFFHTERGLNCRDGFSDSKACFMLWGPNLISPQT